MHVPGLPAPKRFVYLGGCLALALTIAGCSNSRRMVDPRTPAPAPARTTQAPLYNAPSDDVIAPQSGGGYAGGGYAGGGYAGGGYAGGGYAGGGYVPSSRGTGPIIAEPLAEPAAPSSRANAPVMTSPASPLTPSTAVSSSPPSQPSTLPSSSGRNVADLRSANERTPPRAQGTGVMGGWTAQDSTGARCKVQLSSSPAIDLYKASSSGCSNKELSKITAWNQQDGEIYLYQSGGTIAARLRPSDSGYEGVMTKSSAALRLSR
jgi:hypothetical protein